MGQEQANILGATLNDMSGGLNSNKISTQISDSDAINAQNVYYYDGFLKKMFGATRVNTMIGGEESTDSINGIYDFQMRDATRNLVVVTASAIYYEKSGS